MKHITVGTTLSALLLCAACAKEPPSDKDAPAAQPAQKSGQPSFTAPKGETMSAEVLLRTRAALSYYEQLRASLAGDDLKPVADQATKLEEVTRVAAGKASGKAKDSLEEATKAAGGLKAAKDIGAARLAFGELSRHVVALVSAEKELQRGQFVFECPMAKGYKRWIQPNDRMANPYMGKKMLECGSKVGWSS
ncbi:MAG: DUF3347 domain-containing protein [Polyangiaceae bacterium]